MADGRHYFQILKLAHSGGNGYRLQRRDMVFGSRVGFLGSANLMAQLSKFRNPRWRLTAMLDIQKYP